VFAAAEFQTTYQSGTTTITAAATNCSSTQATLTTVGPTPTKLAVYLLPAALPADGETYDNVQVQLRTPRENPPRTPWAT
jgi:hypothetical protein